MPSFSSKKEVNNMIINVPPAFFVKAVWFLSTLLLVLIIYYLINVGNNYIPEKKRIKINNSKILIFIGTFLCLYFLFFIFNKYTILSDTFFTIILSAIFAYILNPLVDYFESKGMKKIFAVITIYLIILGILFILAFLVIPSSSKEIKKLINSIPGYFNNITEFVDGIYKRYYSSIGDLPPLLQGIETAIMNNIQKIENVVIEGTKSFVEGVISSLSKVISLVLTPILTFYFLIDKSFFKKNIKGLVPIKYRKEAFGLFQEIDISVSKFVRGRLIMALSVGVATTIFLLLMDVDFAIVIGFITGIADIIPYIGPLLGFLPAVIFAFLLSPIKALWVSIFFILIQWAENNILAPKILGDSTGMHPLTILLAIITGGAIFGVFGMILSVPFIAIVKILFVFIKEKVKSIPG